MESPLNDRSLYSQFFHVYPRRGPSLSGIATPAAHAKLSVFPRVPAPVAPMGPRGAPWGPMGPMGAPWRPMGPYGAPMGTRARTWPRQTRPGLSRQTPARGLGLGRVAIIGLLGLSVPPQHLLGSGGSTLDATQEPRHIWPPHNETPHTHPTPQGSCYAQWVGTRLQKYTDA